jgi:hypothetical protein
VGSSGIFDQGQALGEAPRRRGAYDAWRQDAIHDLTPEIGLKGFSQLPTKHLDTAEEGESSGGKSARSRLMVRLNISAPTSFHLRCAVARYHLAGGTGRWCDHRSRHPDHPAFVWEEALFEQYKDQIAGQVEHGESSTCGPITLMRDLTVNANFFRSAEQRNLLETFCRSSSIGIHNVRLHCRPHLHRRPLRKRSDAP